MGYQRILFLVKRFYSGQDLMSTGFGRYGNLPAELRKLGHTVAVIALHGNAEDSREVVIHGVLYRSASYLQWLADQGTALGRFDPTVVITGGHLHFGLLGWFTKHFHQVPAVYDLYDYYPAFTPRLHPIARAVFAWLIRRHDAVSVVSEALAAYARPLSPAVVVVRNATSMGSMKRVPRDQARRLLGLPSEGMLLGYCGQLSPYVLWEDLEQALQEVAPPGLAWWLVQMGPPPRAHHGRAHPHSIFLGNRSVEEVALLIQACDIMLAPYRDCPQVAYSSACKLSEYVAMEATVVASRNGDWQHFLPAGYPGLFDPADSSSLRDALRSQMQNPRPLRPQVDVTWRHQALLLSEGVAACCAKAAESSA